MSVILLLLLAMTGGFYLYRYNIVSEPFEITDELGGNIFPSAVLSVAVTDTLIVMPADTSYLGNPKSCIGIRVKSDKTNSKLRIKVAESPFLVSPFQNLFCLKLVQNTLFIRILYGNMMH